MTVIKPFKGLRPSPERAALLTSSPHEVFDGPNSFEYFCQHPFVSLCVAHSEFHFENLDDNRSNLINNLVSNNFATLKQQDLIVQDELECLYLYELKTKQHSQIGVVACLPLDEYDTGLVKKHEKTFTDKLDHRKDMLKHVRMLPNPIYLTYRARDDINHLVNKCAKEKPICSFSSEDTVQHTLWKVGHTSALVQAFCQISCTYIADGHHRIKSMSNCRAELMQENSQHTGMEAYNYFMAALFPHNQLQILPYNRVITSLFGRSRTKIIALLRQSYEVSKGPYTAPKEKGHCCLYLKKQWYYLTPLKSNRLPEDPVDALEVSLLHRNILKPVFGIDDARTNRQIQCIEGALGLKHLTITVDDSLESGCALVLYPTSIEELMLISDIGRTMAPKATWFEPKLLSGMIIHEFK